MSYNHDKPQMYFPLKNELSFKESSLCVKVSLLIMTAVNIRVYNCILIIVKYKFNSSHKYGWS